MELEEIPDAIRYDDPITERVDTGNNPATEMWISDPNRGLQDDRLLDMPPDRDDDSEDGPTDEPEVIFEVPPLMTEADVREILGRGAGEVERQYQLHGIDALGWYTTFHQKHVQHGIGIRFEGALFLAVTAFADLNLAVHRKCELAFHAILRHELFHFAADCMTANWELSTGHAVFWKARDRHRNKQGYMELEEALANAYMLRGFKNPTRRLSNSAGGYQALKRMCQDQPAGYKDGPKYVRTRGPREKSYFGAAYELSEKYQHASDAPWRSPRTLDALIFYPDLIRIDWTRCPIMVSDEHDLQAMLGIGISYFDAVQITEETKSFTRSLSKLDRRIQTLWSTRKTELSRSTALKSLDFKQWQRDGPDIIYSMRLDGNYRAHLRYVRDGGVWLAEQIGDHKTMKHG